jgi:hypothetical protein
LAVITATTWIISFPPFMNAGKTLAGASDGGNAATR